MIKIVTKIHCLFAARVMAEELTRLGYKAVVVDKWDSADLSLYIIYQASGSTNLPENYILMQTEPWNSHWFNDSYRSIIRKAKAVFDYAGINMSKYSDLNNNVFLVPPIVKHQQLIEKDIPFLFYGWIEGSTRRSEMIDKIERYLGRKIMVVTDKTGQEMWDLLSRTEVVINIHYHSESPLEAYRITESLSHWCCVLNEEVDNGFRMIFPKSMDKNAYHLESAMHSLKLSGLV